MCQGNNRKERTAEEFSPVVIELTKRFGFLFTGDEIVVREELKKQVVTSLLDENAGRELKKSSMDWEAKEHEGKMQYMHILHDIREEFKISITDDQKNHSTGFDRT